MGEIAYRLSKAGVGRTRGFTVNAANYQPTAESVKYGTWISKCLLYGAHGGGAPARFKECPSQYLAGKDGAKDWTSPEKWYAENVDRAPWAASAGVRPAHFVVDTSRNGRGTLDAAVFARPPFNQPPEVIQKLKAGDWCNAPTAGVGARPTARTGVPLADAFLWIKTPGHSDGSCDIAGNTRAWDYARFNPWKISGAPQLHFDPLWGMVDPPAGEWFPEAAVQLARNADPRLVEGEPPHVAEGPPAVARPVAPAASDASGRPPGRPGGRSARRPERAPQTASSRAQPRPGRRRPRRSRARCRQPSIPRTRTGDGTRHALRFSMVRPLICCVLLPLAPLAPRAALGRRGSARAGGRRLRPGIELAEQGLFAAALEQFKSAYEKSPHFAVLYNIGQAQMALGRPIEAIEALTRYLRDGADQVPLSRREQVQAQVALLESRLAELSVTTDRPGALVTVDGREVGKTPLYQPIRLAAGTHTVSITMDGITPIIRAIDLREGERRALAFVVPPGIAPKPVATEPPAASVARAAAATAATARLAKVVLRGRGGRRRRRSGSAWRLPLEPGALRRLAGDRHVVADARARQRGLPRRRRREQRARRFAHDREPRDRRPFDCERRSDCRRRGAVPGGRRAPSRAGRLHGACRGSGRVAGRRVWRRLVPTHSAGARRGDGEPERRLRVAVAGRAGLFRRPDRRSRRGHRRRLRRRRLHSGDARLRLLAMLCVQSPDEPRLSV